MARETKTFFVVDEVMLISSAQSNDATIVKVECGDYSASGTAKRETGDPFDSEVGLNLALARALESMASKLKRSVKKRAFDAHRNPNLPNNIKDPVANVAAAVNYVKSRYGNIQQASPGLPPKIYVLCGENLPDEHAPTKKLSSWASFVQNIRESWSR